MPIKVSDKPITAFCTHRQKYEFNYLPFGIQSGPSYMCRLMDAVLQGLAWEICMPYLDDVGVTKLVVCFYAVGALWCGHILISALWCETWIVSFNEISTLPQVE